MDDEKALLVATTAPAAPAASPAKERDQLAAALDAERKARAKSVMMMIEQICKEHNCKFVANPVLVEQPSGGFVITANPGILAL